MKVARIDMGNSYVGSADRAIFDGFDVGDVEKIVEVGVGTGVVFNAEFIIGKVVNLIVG